MGGAEMKRRTRGERNQEAEQELRREQVVVNSLYWPRVLRKIPRTVQPREWGELRQEYHRRRSQYQRAGRGELPWPELDLREIRRIVFGWDGPSPERFFSYDDQFDPEKREHVERVLADLPDSPIGIAILLTEYELIVETLRKLATLQRGKEFRWIATTNEEAATRNLAKRAEELGSLLRDARESLGRMGLELQEDGKLRTIPGGRGGKPGEYLNTTIRKLADYLLPIYRAAFDEKPENSDRLRAQIRQVLVPYFASEDLSTERKGRIWNQVNNLLRA